MKYEYIAIKEIDGEIKVVVNEKQKPEYTTARDYPSALEYWKSKHQYISFHSQTEINKVLIHIEKNDGISFIWGRGQATNTVLGYDRVDFDYPL